MALRECPSCGKKVSDSVNTCIHCGYDFKKAAKEQAEREQQANPQKKFSEFSINERMEYEREFYDNHVGYKKAIRVSKLTGSFSYIILLSYFPAVILSIIIAVIALAKLLNWFTVPYINRELLLAAVVISIVLLAVGVLCSIICKIFKNKSTRDLAQYANEFIDWLRETKQIYF